MENYGFLSIIPPILAIILAIRTKNVLFSLATGLFFGTLVLSEWNPFKAFFVIFNDYVYVEITKAWHTQSLANLLIIGAFVAIIGQSGGSLAFARKVTKSINSRAKAELSMWFGGLFVWFTDSGNSLLVGPVFQTIGDKVKVSREKFAYILDATSSPICSLVPIISWGVYIMGLIDVELKALSNTQLTSWEIFTKAVPFQFYSILTLIMVGYVAYTQFDYGPMLKAQKRAQTGEVIRKGAIPLRKTTEVVLPQGVEPRAITMVVPLIVLLGTMFTIFFINGFPYQQLEGTVLRVGIALGFIAGAITSVILSKITGIMTLKVAEQSMFKGMKDMIQLMLIMIFAWSLGDVSKTLGTANYIIEMSEGFLNPAFLPVILFTIGALMSLATGSSWGPYAILMPIAIPMSMMMGAPLFVTVASVISGGLFGDHCSPLSDTTLLASMGAASDHMDHFQTQFPYAVTVAGISAILFAIAGFTENAVIVLPGIIALFVVIYVLHRISLKKYTSEIEEGTNVKDMVENIR